MSLETFGVMPYTWETPTKKKGGKAGRTLGAKKPDFGTSTAGRSGYWAESKMTGDNVLFWNRYPWGLKRLKWRLHSVALVLLRPSFQIFPMSTPIFYMGVPPGSYLDFSNADYPHGCSSGTSGWCRVCRIFLNPILYFRGRGDCFAALLQTDSKIDAIEMNNSNGKCSNHTHSDKKKTLSSFQIMPA